MKDKPYSIEQFRMDMMRQATASSWLERTMENIVVFMMEFGVSDPNVYLQMPASAFDEVTEHFATIKKAQAPKTPQKKVDSFGI